MPKQSEYQEFRANFMQMIHRFDKLAPGLVNSGGASGDIALRSRRVVSLIEQALPDDDGGALTQQDYALLKMAMVRADELMDVLDPLAATTDIRPARFDDEVFGVRLKSVDPADYGDLIGMLSLQSGRGGGKKETLDIVCKLIEGFDEIFKGSVFEILKKILIIIFQVLAGRTVLPQKLIDLIPTLFKFIDDLIGGDDGPIPTPPPEVIPPGGQPQAKCELCLFISTLDEALNVRVPAGQRVIVSFETTTDPNGRGILSVSTVDGIKGLFVGDSSEIITGQKDFRLKFSSAMVLSAKVRIRFV